jgi:hypothetical protein
MARSFRGRIPGSQPDEAGSIPARVTPNQVVEQADTRLSESRALAAWEFKSPLGYLMTRVGECPAEFHKLRPPGATPGPATET